MPNPRVPSRRFRPPQPAHGAATVRIEKLGERGVGIGHLREGGRDGKAVMVPFSAPGDVADVQIVHETSSYARARILRLREASPDRTEPPCPVHGLCGGCSLQHIRYPRQLELKHALLEEAFRGVRGGCRVEAVAPSPRELGYRNKLQMQIGLRGGRLVAGFYRAQSHDIVPVDTCLLHSAAANALAQDLLEILRARRLHAYDAGKRTGELRDIVIRESSADGGLLLTLVTSRPRLRDEDAISRELFRSHSALRGFYLFHNPHASEYVFKDGERAGLESGTSPLRRIHGGGIRERLAGCDLAISPLSFFQVNAAQAEGIVARLAREIGDGPPGGRLVDAYAGVGALSLPLASRFREVLAIESVPHSAELARENARLNRSRTFRVRHGDAAEELERAGSRPEAAHTGAPDGSDVIIVDPPRAGLDGGVVRAISRSGAPLVLYLSCEPATQARDVALLVSGGGYRVAAIAPFDMFPQTFHVECLVALRKDLR